MLNYPKIIAHNILSYYEYQSNIPHLSKLQDSKQIGPFQSFFKDAFKSAKNNFRPGSMIDDYNNYYINELGLRGILDSDSEILSAGCSITFGCGIPDEGTWPYILSKKINRSIVNLSFPGESIESICNNIIVYSVKYKMPKKIFCFFPGLFRSWAVADDNFYSSNKQEDNLNFNNLYNKSVNPQIWFDKKTNEMFMVERKLNPIDDKMETMLSPHQLILNSINAISLLELFCLSHNIDLIWTTWDSNSDIIMQKLNTIPDFKLKKYAKFLNNDVRTISSYDNFSTYDKLICESDHLSELKDHFAWDMGTDYYILDGKKDPHIKPHPGIHYQTHVADFFEKHLQML